MTESYERLCSEWSLLQQEWQTARRLWGDAVADRFEREFWGEWETQFPSLLRDLADVQELTDRALRTLS